MLCLHTKFHMRSPSGSLVIVTKPKTNTVTATVFLFTFYQKKKKKTKVTYFFENLLTCVTSVRKLSVTFTS